MWRRWTCCLGAVLLISACSHGTLTRVVRTDGTTVVGELTAARPDAVVLKLSDGRTITIPRGTISSIASADAPSVATNSSATGKASGPSAAKGGSASGSAATGPAGSGAAAGGAVAGGAAAGGPGAGGANAGRAPASNAGSGSASGGANAGGAIAGGTGANGSSPAAANPRGGVSGAAGGASNGGSRVLRDAVAPSGTTLELALSRAIGSDSSNVDDKVDAVLRAPVIINGEPILEAGALAHGTITEATPSEKAEGRGRLSVRFDTIQLGSRTVSIQTAPMRWEAAGISRKPAGESRGGKRSVFGKLVDKTKKGLHIGDDDAPRGSADVRIAAGAVLRVRLEQPTRIAP